MTLFKVIEPFFLKNNNIIKIGLANYFSVGLN